MHTSRDTQRQIHIALTFDDNFWAPTYATMRGICATTSERENVHFHLIHTGLGDDRIERLSSVTQEFGARINYYDISTNDILRDKINSFPKIRSRNLNDIVYARLFLCEILPVEIEKIIYIDSDILVRVAIEEFYDMDLEGKVVAAANCPHRVMFQSTRDVTPKSYFQTDAPYFNAGFLLIDAEKYRKIDFAAAVRENVKETQRIQLYYDQDILNIALRGNWKILDWRWNLQNPLPHHESFDPKIIHYTGSNKPWRLFSSTAFKRQYRHTMTNDVFYRFMRERWVRTIRSWLRR